MSLKDVIALLIYLLSGHRILSYRLQTPLVLKMLVIIFSYTYLHDFFENEVKWRLEQYLDIGTSNASDEYLKWLEPYIIIIRT